MGEYAASNKTEDTRVQRGALGDGMLEHCAPPGPGFGWGPPPPPVAGRARGDAGRRPSRKASPAAGDFEELQLVRGVHCVPEGLLFAAGLGVTPLNCMNDWVHTYLHRGFGGCGV